MFCNAMCSLNANKNSTLATNQICQNPTSKVIEVGNEQKLELFMCETLLNINAYFKTKQLTMNLDFDEGFGLPLCSSSTFFETRSTARRNSIICLAATVFFSSTDKRLPPLHSQPHFRSVGQKFVIILK